MSLPTITQSSDGKIHDFYEKLVIHSQALATMGKLKLPTIRADLVRTDEDWQEWEFWQFIEALRKWKDTNSIPLEDNRKLNPIKSEKLYQTSQDDWNPKILFMLQQERSQIKRLQNNSQSRK